MSELYHIGTPHEGAVPHSGRYAWGSGEKPFQGVDIFSRVRQLRVEGMSEKKIAEALGMSTGELRARYSRAKDYEQNYRV